MPAPVRALRVASMPADQVRPPSYAELATWRHLRQQPSDAASLLCETAGCGAPWWGAHDFDGCRKCPDCMAGRQGRVGGWPAPVVQPPGVYEHPYPLAATAA